MSATAAAEGSTVPVVAGQLTIPPTITTISSTSEAVPINAARSPCRATGTRAATEPVGITPKPYHLIRCNPVDTRHEGEARHAKPVPVAPATARRQVPRFLSRLD